MRGLLTIYRRELAGLFLGPLAWVLLCMALFLNGWYFTLYLFGTQGNVTESFLLAMGGSTVFWAFMIVLPPLITMRMISEESRSGMLEFLLTAPVSDAAVVLGKLLAATTLMTLLWSSALVYGLTIQSLGTTPDWPALIGGVLGASLVSCLFCAVGLIASAATSTPLLAAFLGLVFDVAILSVRWIGGLFTVSPDHWARKVLAELDLVAQFQASFMVGVLDSKTVVSLLAASGLAVFLATRLLEMRRWR